MVADRASANAVTPDQLIPYAQSVCGLESRLINDCVLYLGGASGVLVAYPLHDPLDFESAEKAVELAASLPELNNLAVLGAKRPRCAPPEASCREDAYLQIELPAREPRGKLANMLRRASRDVAIETASGQGAWRQEHQKLAENFCGRQALDSGSIFLFEHLEPYFGAAPEALLFSARTSDNALAGLAIGDFTSLGTAFYMFAFRRQDAPPGTADLLLAAIIAEAQRRGHERVNLGLGINTGVKFFKKKWGATEFLPFVETSWRPAGQTRKKSWLGRLFGK